MSTRPEATPPKQDAKAGDMLTVGHKWSIAGPSEEVVDVIYAAQQTFNRDYVRKLLIPAYLIDEPRIRAEEREATVREVVAWLQAFPSACEPVLLADRIARKFGAEAHFIDQTPRSDAVPEQDPAGWEIRRRMPDVPGPDRKVIVERRRKAGPWQRVETPSEVDDASAERRKQASDPVNPYVDSYCWDPEGWEMAGEYSVQPAATTTRGQAASYFSKFGPGYLPDVRVWKRYVEPLTRQDVWDDYGRERWEERFDLDDDGGPSEPPSEWEPDEDDPVWRFVHRSHPAAIAVWICGVKGNDPPHNPAKP